MLPQESRKNMYSMRRTLSRVITVVVVLFTVRKAKEVDHIPAHRCQLASGGLPSRSSGRVPACAALILSFDFQRRCGSIQDMQWAWAEMEKTDHRVKTNT